MTFLIRKMKWWRGNIRWKNRSLIAGESDRNSDLSDLQQALEFLGPQFPHLPAWDERHHSCLQATAPCMTDCGKKAPHRGFPGVSVAKNPPANARDVGSIPGSGRSHMCRATEPVCHYWACALEPTHLNYWSLHTLDFRLHSKKSHHSEKPTHHN